MTDAPDTARRYRKQLRRLLRWGVVCFLVTGIGFFISNTNEQLGAVLVFIGIAMFAAGIFTLSRCPKCRRLIWRRSVDDYTGVCVSCGAILTSVVSPEVASIANEETKVMRLFRVRYQTFRNFRLGAAFAFAMLMFILYDNGLNFPTALIGVGALFGWAAAWNDYRCPNCETPLSRHILLDTKPTSCPSCATALRLT